jgi:YggT family protein
MGGSYVGNAATFVIETVFSLYILIVMLRLLLQLVRADFYNPLSQAIVRITQPPLKLLRRIVPGYSGVDLASVVLLLALQMLELWLVLLMLGRDAALAGLVVLSVARLLQLLAYVFMFAIFALVILSWIQPNAYNPLVAVLNAIGAPLLRPARRMLPPMGGLDLSPIVVLLALGVVLRLLVAPLEDLGVSML